MPSIRQIITAGALSMGSLVSAQQYSLSEEFDKTNFFSEFDFFDGPDPTHGFVRYLNKFDSNERLLAGHVKDKDVVYLGCDNQTPGVTAGRDSVRVSSKAKFNTGLFVADIEHMPGGCGVWPAYWMFGDNWPNRGEIDIIEGVNSQQTNAITLHTGPGCSMSAEGGAEMHNSDCNADEGKMGCGQPTQMPFGKAFNDMGGGVLATEWTTAAIQVWFFPRDGIPADVAAGTPDPASWGAPTARFAGGSGCDIGSHFKDHQIVFNTDFCGDWAGAVWSQDEECRALAPSCEEWVAHNPDAFKNAYWLINSLKIYNQSGPNRRDNAKRTFFQG